MRCPSCQQPNPQDASFCNRCGHRLPDDLSCHAGDATAVEGAPQQPGSERRLITVMFCDIVGSTALARGLELETLRDVVQSYQLRCGEVIEEFDGYVAQYLGDGVMAYFGYPSPREGDAERAVHAALRIFERLQGLSDQLEQEAGVRLAVRMAIHSGLVVISNMGGKRHHEMLALGETPNFAARLLQLATPGSILISEGTRILLRGRFVCVDLGLHALKGIEQSVRLHRVLSARRCPPRLGIADLPEGVPLVGRREELALLWERWVCVRAGVGQVVLLHGEAGIGKSRLVRAFRDRLRGDEAVWLECRCSPYGRGSALRPVIELLEDLLVFEPEDSAGEKLRKLQEGLARVGLDGQDEVRTIASLLSIALPGVTAVEAKDPRWERDRILEILRDWLFRLGSQRPAVVVVEDAHWADPSSVELSRLLVAQASRAAVLLLLVYRPEFEAGWPIPEQVTSIELTRLAEEDVAKLVTGVAGKRALPRELESEIVARADGVPLFAEELAKAVLEAGPGNAVSALRARNGAPARPAIPSTLHGSLMARFDRLPEARELAQVAAAIGREFPYGLLKSVSKLEDEGLRAKLGQLVDAGLLYQGGEPPSAVYCFKHGLIRDVVYESLIEQERKQIHRQIADELSNHDPETSEARPELIAHHFTLAGLREPAVHHCERAGRRAGERAAYREAIDHLRCGLDLLQVLPETAERVRRELQLQVSLGAAFTAARGLGAPEAERVYERARSLLRRTGDSSPLFPALRSLWAFHNARAELELASDLARQLLELAERDRRAVLLVEAHRARAETRLYQGQLVLAEQELERLRQLYDRRDRAFFASQSAQDPGVTYYAFAALVSWLRGCPRRAFEQSTNAIELAQSLEDPSSLAHALVFGALVHHLRGEWEAALDRAERAVSLAREHRFPLWLAMGEVMQGAARVEGGALEAGLAQLERGFAAYEATGARIGRPVQLGLLAAAYQRAERLEDSLNAVDTALACVRDTGERMYEAGLLSLRGDLALASAPERWKEGEQYLRTAIRVAQEQDAKSLELHATLNLARLLHEHGRAAEGRGMLSAIHDEFSEGPGTADAMAAREFLAEKR